MVWFVSWKLFTYNLFTPDIYNFEFKKVQLLIYILYI